MSGAAGAAIAEGGWDASGWALHPGFLPAEEVGELVREAERLTADPALSAGRGAVPNSATRSDRIDPVIDLSPRFAALARDPRLTELAGRLLGGDVQLMKDKFIAKPPGAKGYATHQDAAYWPGLGIDARRFLTAVLFLDDSTAAKGAIECASGHHLSLLTNPDRIADPDETRLGEFTTIEAKAGDLLLLHALTPHRSGPNRSDSMRRALLFTYGVDARPELYTIYHCLQKDWRSS